MQAKQHRSHNHKWCYLSSNAVKPQALCSAHVSVAEPLATHDPNRSTLADPKAVLSATACLVSEQ